MAQVTNLTSLGTRPIWMYDVTARVGPGLGNQRDDVALVQLAINAIMRSKNLRDSRARFDPRPTNPLSNISHGYPLLSFLVVDGYFGPETSNAVITYQRANGNVCDGIIDPVYPLIGKGNHLVIRMRTIYGLNVDTLLYTGRMLDEHKFPPFLKL